MQEDGELEGLNARQYGLEQRIVEIAAGNIRAEIDPAHPWQFAGTLKLGESAVGIKHGKGQERDEPCGICLVRRGRRVIPCFGKFRGKFGVTPIQHGGGKRDCLDCHSLLVHVGDARLQVNKFRGQRAVASSRGLDEPAFVGGVIRSVEALAVRGHKIKIGLGKIVGVNVNHATV